MNRVKAKDWHHRLPLAMSSVSPSQSLSHNFTSAQFGMASSQFTTLQTPSVGLERVQTATFPLINMELSKKSFIWRKLHAMVQSITPDPFLSAQAHLVPRKGHDPSPASHFLPGLLCFRSISVATALYFVSTIAHILSVFLSLGETVPSHSRQRVEDRQLCSQCQLFYL